MRHVAIAGVLLSSVALTAAQQPAPAFEVASIKEHPFVGGGVMGVEFKPGGRMRATMAPIQMLITSAYGILPAQLRFAPDVPTALLRTFYDVDARAEAGAIPSGRLSRDSIQKMESMLQALLADRFKLKVRTEKKELSIYALVVDKGGVKFQRSPERDCVATPSACGWSTVGPASGVVGQSVTLNRLADALTGFLDRSVIDKSGVDDAFDITLPPFSRGAQTAGAVADGAPVDVTAPSLFAVLRDAGLRLEPRQQLLDVYVVDHLERLFAN